MSMGPGPSLPLLCQGWEQGEELSSSAMARQGRGMGRGDWRRGTAPQSPDFPSIHLPSLRSLNICSVLLPQPFIS